MNRTRMLGIAVALLCGATVVAEAAAADTRARAGLARPNAGQAVQQGRIVGGTLTTAGTRTYQVRLYRNSDALACGGTIIADNWVLTAAHCVNNPQTEANRVRVGFTRTSGTGGTYHTVDRIVRHPSSNGGIVYDYALLRITGTFASTLERVAIPTADVVQAVGQPGSNVIVSGWGLTSEGGNTSDDLREITIPIVTDTTCRQSLGTSASSFDDASMICAGSAGKDSCTGDSGGPMVAAYNNRTWSIGVTSWGLGCARPNSYGVYADTYHVRDWILGQIGNTGGSTVQTYPSNTPLAIADLGSVTSTIAVAGRTGNAPNNAQISVNISHTYRGDLRIELLAPDGTPYLLKSPSSSDGTANLVTTYTKDLSSESLNGNWRLRVSDVYQGDTGTLNSWNIRF